MLVATTLLYHLNIIFTVTNKQFTFNVSVPLGGAGIILLKFPAPYGGGRKNFARSYA